MVKHLVAALFALLLLVTADVSAQTTTPVVEPLRCGPCDIGYQWGGRCLIPGMNVSSSAGLAPADTGARTVISPSSYGGTDPQKLLAAMQAADALPDNTAAVVLDRVYEVNVGTAVPDTVMVTGGGIRRACTPTATASAFTSGSGSCVTVDDASAFVNGPYVAFVTDTTYAGSRDGSTQRIITLSSHTDTTLCHTGTINFDVPDGATAIVVGDLLLANTKTGVIVDSVFFDGANDCNGYTHDWTLNNALPIRGDNIVRNSVFYDSPSETMTSCGGTIENNRGYQLQGSLTHVSCSVSDEPVQYIRNNTVMGANLATDAIMEHSEGVITFSANAGDLRLSGNKFIDGEEGALGVFDSADDPTHVVGDCYHGFSHVADNVDATKSTVLQHSGLRLEDVPRLWADE